MSRNSGSASTVVRLSKTSKRRGAFDLGHPGGLDVVSVPGGVAIASWCGVFVNCAAGPGTATAATATTTTTSTPRRSGNRAQ